MNEVSNQKQGLLIGISLCLFALGVFLRVYHFWVPELWLDEYSYWWVAARGGWREAMLRAWDYQVQSPVTYLLAKISVTAFGAGPFSLRLPSVIEGIATLALAYPVGKHLLGSRWAGAMTMAVFAVSDIMISHAQQARPYAAALFGLMLTCYAYLRLLDQEKARYRVTYVIGAAVTIYADYKFGLFFFGQLLHMLLLRKGNAWWKAWLLNFGVLALICVPGVIHLAHTFGRREALDWIPSMDSLLAPIQLLLKLVNTDLISVMGFFLLSCCLLGKISYSRKPRRRVGFVLIWIGASALCLTAIPPFFGISLAHQRYALVAAPGLLFLIAAALDVQARRPVWQWAPLAVFLLLSFEMTLLPLFQQNGVFCPRMNQGWAKAVSSMEPELQKGDLVVFRSGAIESDLLALPGPDPEIVSFVSWPVLANLKDRHDHVTFIGLPYHSQRSNTQGYFKAVVKRIVQSQRTWIIGLLGQGNLSQFARNITQRFPALALTKSGQYGTIFVGLIERKTQRS